jgi:hypothetical protein
MAQTTTAINACDAVIRLENSTGGLQDVSGSSNECSMELTNELGLLRTFQARWPVRLACKSDAAIELKVVYTEADSEGCSILKDWFYNHHGENRQISISLPDEGVGAEVYTFDCLLEKLSIPVKSDDANPILVSASLKPSGEFTWAMVAT